MTNDTIAPPAPTLLTELPSTSSTIRLLWEQSNIGDVVRWDLYRGVNGAVPEILLRLTSNVAIDTTVLPGESYCYQIQAVDASGNTSAFSEVLCLIAVNTNSPINNTNNSTNGWDVPVVESLTCTQVISNAQLQLGINTIESGCYQVPESLQLGNAITLKIAQDTVLKFGQAAKLIVLDGGTLTVEGSTEAPVVFTGNISAPGYWGGIEFQNSMSPGNIIQGAVVQNGGGGDSLAAISTINGESRFRMVDTLVRYNEKQALELRIDNNIIDEFRGNRITENDAIGIVNLALVNSLTGNSDFTGNTKDKIDVPRNSFSNAQLTIPDLGVPLSWNGVSINNGSLQIEPGAVLEMVPESSINVDGTFSAIGTAENPIVLMGNSNSTRRGWGGISLEGRSDKMFNHVTILDGGSSSLNSGAIQWFCRSTDGATLSINNTEISFSESWGIWIFAEDMCTTDLGQNIIYFDNALGDINLLSP